MSTHALGQLQLANILQTAALRYAKKEAIYCHTSQRRFSFRTLEERANRLANSLLNKGYQSGDVLALLCSNRIELVDWYFALALTGIIGIPLNYRLAANEMAGLVEDMQARGLIFESRFNKEARHIQSCCPGLEDIVSFGTDRDPETQDYHALLDAASPNSPGLSIDEEAPYYYNLTSGTTGLPKAYTLSHYNNAAGSIQIALAHDLSSRDTVLTVFPAFGRVGIAWITGSILVGARNVLMNFEPEPTLSLIQDEAITITNLVPTMASLLTSVPTLDNYDLSSLRGIVYAGSPLQPALREKSEKFICCHTYEYYGMQESGILAHSTPEDRKRKPDSIGQQMTFTDLRVVDDHGEDVAPGEIGQIIARAPTAITCYRNNPKKTAETFRDGWLYTGDLGRFDEDSFLYIAGREKDMIISGGQNIFSVEVEACILELDAVIDCTVIGLPDKTWGERVTAVIQTSVDIDQTLIIDHCKSKLAGFKSPRQVIFIRDPLPRTPTGKVTKYVLVEQYS